MHSRSYRYLAALAILPLAGGCMQMTRHSNTMVFGTTTTVALKVGQNANQVPEIVIGYDRQEVVIMPLLANTTERAGSDNFLNPCEPFAERLTVQEGTKITTTETMQRGDVTGTDPEAMIHPCKFVGLRAGGDGLMIQDSYSVLASFGAQIEGDAAANKGSVGLAQYFATGVAAQILAATGGAAVVAVGQGAEESAKSPTRAAAAASIVGANAIPADLGPTFSANFNKLRDEIRETTNNDDRARKIAALYNRLSPRPAFTATDECRKSVNDCLSAIENDRSSLFPASNFGETVAGWSGY